MIRVYDKERQLPEEIPLSVIAEPRGAYDEDVQTQLSAVEGPAHLALSRVTANQPLNTADWSVVLYYVAVMMYRGPQRLGGPEMSRSVAPEDAAGELSRKLDALEASYRADTRAAARRRAEIAAAAETFRPTSVKETADTRPDGWPGEKMFRLIARMTWRLLIAAREDRFVTSDRPAVYSDDLAIGKGEQEITLPLSPQLALIGEGRIESGAILTYSVKNDLVREVNRRVVSGADRFVFANAEYEWISKVAQKAKPYLRRVDWRGIRPLG
jgi:hypothetical protein